MTNVIITMAGFGRRFLEAGYTVPKYRIEAHGRSLFQWSMLSLRSFIEAGARFVFVVRAADEAEDFIRAEARAIGIAEVAIVETEQPTDGQATSALLAGPALPNPSAPMLIYNIDTFIHPRAISAADVRGAGWIPCFPGAGDHWSFAKTGADGRVTEVREKVRISEHATVGLYWFDSFDRYRSAYDAYYLEFACFEAGERYVAPLYNQLIEQRAPVFIQEVGASAVVPLGVPAEVESFRQHAAPRLD